MVRYFLYSNNYFIDNNINNIIKTDHLQENLMCLGLGRALYGSFFFLGFLIGLKEWVNLKM